MYQKPKNLITSPTLSKGNHIKGNSRQIRRSMTDYEKVKDFLEWADREIPKEKDKELKQAMETIRDRIRAKLKEKGEL